MLKIMYDFSFPCKCVFHYSYYFMSLCVFSWLGWPCVYVYYMCVSMSVPIMFSYFHVMFYNPCWLGHSIFLIMCCRMLVGSLHFLDYVLSKIVHNVLVGFAISLRKGAPRCALCTQHATVNNERNGEREETNEVTKERERKRILLPKIQ